MGRLRFGVPTKYAMTHMTVEELELNAKIALYPSYACSIIDGALSAIGIYLFEDSRMHAPNALIMIAYIIIALIVATSAIVGIRYTRLRNTSHGASIAKERTNTIVLGDMAEQEIEQEIIDSENNMANRILLISWIYEVGSNAYALGRMWWTAILPLFLLFGKGGSLFDALNAIITILVTLGVSWLIPFIGHRGEAWGYKYREAALRQERQDKILWYSTAKQVQARTTTGKII